MCLKIARIGVATDTISLGEKYYDNFFFKKRIKAFLGHDRETEASSQDSSMTPQWAARCCSLAHPETNYSPLEEEQVTRTQRTNNLSVSRCVQLNKEQILHPNQAPSNDSSIVALWSPCHVGQAKTNVMSMQ